MGGLTVVVAQPHTRSSVCRITTQKVRLFTVCIEHRNAVFCSYNTDSVGCCVLYGSRVSKGNSVKKHQVPLLPAVTTKDCISVVLLHPCFFYTYTVKIAIQQLIIRPGKLDL